MVVELPQNAGWATAPGVEVVVDGNALVVLDDGVGIDAMQTLAHIAESG
ncbi:hypothetical protein ANDA3_4107 [plant metagenome]|uniref:Uncharacterized protein n=1 Tax=plant metagenome TaxID=1297885 RepID=A0A484PYJ5_9ZZZZ